MVLTRSAHGSAHRPARRRTSTRWPALSAVAVVALAACGGTTGTDDEDDEDEDADVVATTTVWADITAGVGCDTPIPSLVPTGADPHSYESSLRDRELLTKAEVIIANGAGLEATAHDLLDIAADDGTTVVEMAAHVDLLTAGADHDDDGEEHDQDDHDDEHDDQDGQDDEEHDEAAHDHGDADPHIWQDPRRVAGALDVIGTAIAATGLPVCTESYRGELLALDAEIEELLAPIPAERRLLVTSHDSLGYFADRYGFDVIGTVIPSTSTLAESSAGQLADLADLVEEQGVPAIFTDAFESAGDAEALADRLGIAVVPLVTGSLTEESPTYVDLLRDNATAIAEALAP